MQVKIETSDSDFPLGNGFNRLLFEIASGAYAGRRVAIYSGDSDTVRLSFADRPYTQFSTPATIIASADPASLTGVIDDAGNIQLLYEVSSDIKSRRLTFADGIYTAGAEVTVYTGDANTSPSVAIAPDGTLWACWTRLETPPVQNVHVKSSTDDGATWGTGPTDVGDEIHSGGLISRSLIAVSGTHIHVVYYYSYDFLVHRSRALSGGSWSTPYTLISGSEASTNFDMVVRSDGLLAVVRSLSDVNYHEFDGNNWSAAQTIYGDPVNDLQLMFKDQVPILFYSKPYDTNQDQRRWIDRPTIG